ncbi:uncharacterized protein LOC119431787 [Dermacentor silvarum]|uniref:uncharacterized protein LOC119431787 n=1 Tax=Dermacentor silvarum TaxID=543639 RepID=UPI002100C7C6|nr:uncharacterized protein LOC119431787 [Dermacentor silvarum]
MEYNLKMAQDYRQQLELKLENCIAVVHLSTVTLDTESMQVLLKVMYEDRCKAYDDPLPQYFLLENILCIEVELRFKSNIGDLERKLKAVSEAFSCKQQRECTFADIVKHLQGYSRLELINEVCGMIIMDPYITYCGIKYFLAIVNSFSMKPEQYTNAQISRCIFYESHCTVMRIFTMLCR